MIEKGDLIKTIIIGYEFTGIVFILVFLKILDIMADNMHEHEIAMINRHIKQAVSRLTMMQKVCALLIMATGWLPIAVIMIVKLMKEDSEN